MNWYIIKTQTNRENKVADLIKDQIEIDDLEDLVEEVAVPEEKVIQNSVSGKNKIVKRRYYPGYVFINAEMTTDLILSIKGTNFTTGFIGGSKPTAMTNPEVKKMLVLNNGDTDSEPSYKIQFNSGEEVRINDGPFEGFNGGVKNIDYDKNILTLEVQVFGRPTTIDVDFSSVNKQ